MKNWKLLKSPFLVQERIMQNLENMYVNIDKKNKLLQTNIPTVDIKHQATTTKKDLVTPDDFINFIENTEVQLKNIVGNNYSKLPIEQKTFITNELIPQMIGQFKRLLRKALKEGKIDFTKLSYFEKEFLSIIHPYSTKNDYDDIETATHTSGYTRFQLPKQNKTQFNMNNPKNLLEEDIEQQRGYDDNYVNSSLINPTRKKIAKLITNLEDINIKSVHYGFSELARDSKILLDQAEEYQRFLSNSNPIQDLVTENYLFGSFEQINNQFNEIISNENELGNEFKKLIEDYNKLFEDFKKMGDEYYQILRIGEQDRNNDLISGNSGPMIFLENYKNLKSSIIKNLNQLVNIRNTNPNIPSLNDFMIIKNNLESSINILDREGRNLINQLNQNNEPHVTFNENENQYDDEEDNYENDYEDNRSENGNEDDRSENGDEDNENEDNEPGLYNFGYGKSKNKSKNKLKLKVNKNRKFSVIKF